MEIKTVPIDRKAALCGMIDIPNSSGIELGPLSRPIVRASEGDIRYVDHATTEELKIKYAVNDGHNVGELVRISYVWNGDGLRNVIPQSEVFDYALGSHVIEHVPDVIGWLNDITSILKPGGVIGLAIPDKRYTFDILRKPTTAAQLIDNHIRKVKRPTAAQVFDHFANVAHVGNPEIMTLWEGGTPQLRRIFEERQAWQFALEGGESYLDCHASVFTPASFRDVFGVFTRLGLVECQIVDFYDTRPFSQEFVVVLQKKGG